MKVTGLTLNLPTTDVAKSYAFYTRMLGFRGGYCQAASCAVSLGGVCLVFCGTGRVSQTLIQQVRVTIGFDDLHAYHSDLQQRFAGRLPEVELDIPGVLSFHVTDPTTGIRLVFTQQGEHLRHREEELS